jgi:TRAP-type C4-dicarboxylate transport system permease small subunit
MHEHPWFQYCAIVARFYLRAVEIAGIAGVALVTVVGAIQVFFRYVLGASLFWSDEVMRYSMIWVVFLVAGLSYSRGEMLGAELLSAALPSRMRQVVEIAGKLCVIGLLLTIAWYGIELTASTATTRSPAMQVPMNYIYAAIPTGSLLLVLHVIAGFFVPLGRE